MNICCISGRLTKSPDVRYSNEMCIARYTLACDRPWKRDTDQKADFISCVAFGKQGEFAEKYLKKGTKIIVSGRIQTGSYERDGQRVYTTDVVAERQEFAESKASNGEGREEYPKVSEVPRKDAESVRLASEWENAEEMELPFV